MQQLDCSKDCPGICPTCNETNKSFKQPKPETWWERNNWWVIGFPFYFGILFGSLWLLSQ